MNNYVTLIDTEKADEKQYEDYKDIVRKGNLLIVLQPGSEEDIQEIIERSTSAEGCLADVLEYQLCNGWYMFREENKGLTDAPILTQDWEEDDQGNLLNFGRLYYYNEYALRDPVEELLRNGFVVFLHHDEPKEIEEE